MEIVDLRVRQLTTSELGRTRYAVAVAAAQFPVEFSASTDAPAFLAASWIESFSEWLPINPTTGTLRIDVPVDTDLKFVAVIGPEGGSEPSCPPDTAFCNANAQTWRAHVTDAPLDSQTAKAWGGRALNQIRFSGAAQLAREDLTAEEITTGNERGFWPVEFAFNEVAWAKTVAVAHFGPPGTVVPELLAAAVEARDHEEFPLVKDADDNVWRIRVPLKAAEKASFHFMVHCGEGVTPETGPIVSDGWDSRLSRPPILATNEIYAEVTDLSSSEVRRRRLAAPGRICDGQERSTRGAQLTEREQENVVVERSVKSSASSFEKGDMVRPSTAADSEQRHVSAIPSGAVKDAVLRGDQKDKDEAAELAASPRPTVPSTLGKGTNNVPSMLSHQTSFENGTASPSDQTSDATRMSTESTSSPRGIAEKDSLANSRSGRKTSGPVKENSPGGLGSSGTNGPSVQERARGVEKNITSRDAENDSPPQPVVDVGAEPETKSRGGWAVVVVPALITLFVAVAMKAMSYSSTREGGVDAEVTAGEGYVIAKEEGLSVQDESDVVRHSITRGS